MLMSRIILTVSFLLLFNGLCGATGFIEPIPRVDAYRQEIGFYQAEVDLEARDATLPDETLKQSGLYLQVELPFEETAAYYVRLGAAKLKLEQSTGESFNDKRYRPWGGVGVKGVLGTNPVVNLGYFVEGSYYSRYKSDDFIFDKYWDATAGVALQAQYKGFGAYVGPVSYYSNAELEIGSGATATSNYYRGKALGVRAGVKIPCGSIAYLSLDGTFGDCTVLGGSLNLAGAGL